MKETEGRVAVVTGGASGIGLALAHRFLRAGMNVVIADVESAALDAATAELSPHGDVLAVRTDVSDLASVEALAAATLERFDAVHVVCNNAGVDAGGWFSDIDLSTWQWVLDVNFWGVLYGCRVFLPLLREQGEGHIFNTASLAAFGTGVPTATPYSVSKFAVLSLTECLDLELRRHNDPIGVSLIVPGPVRTRMSQSERNRPAHVAPSANQDDREALNESRRAFMAEHAIEPEEMAEMAFDALINERFYVVSHPDFALDALAKRARWITDDIRPTAGPLNIAESR